MKLRDYQVGAVDFLLPRARAFIVAPAGSGKTIIAANAAARKAETFFRVVWLANTREQVEQARAACLRQRWPDGVAIDCHCVAARPNVAGADLVIIDECFPAGTSIDGRPIESFRPGDFVNSFNHETGKTEARRVLDVFSRHYDGDIYSFTTALGRSFQCSEGHPIFIYGLGYITAKTAHALFVLRKRTAGSDSDGRSRVQVLQREMRWRLQWKDEAEAVAGAFLQGVRCACDLSAAPATPGSDANGAAVLLAGVLDGIQGASFVGDSIDHEYEISGRYLAENERAKPDAESGDSGENEIVHEGQNVPCSWRKWSGDKTADPASRINRIANGARHFAEGGARQVRVCSEVLQGGSCVRGCSIGDRGGWNVSPAQKVEVLGRAKNGDIVVDWLVDSKVYESGSRCRRDAMRGQDRVYNLHVEGNENYFADGVLVHNCHHLPAKTWWTTVAEAPCAVWGFSATPWSGDWERDTILKAFFGEANFYTVDRKEVQDGGSITPGRVIVHDIDTEGEFDADIMVKTHAEVAVRIKKHPYIPKDEHERRARWQFTAEAVRNNFARNQKIVALAWAAIEAGESVLVLVSTIEHGQRLAMQINAATLVHAKAGKRARAAAITAFRDGSLKCMIATSLADEGLDVPRASVLILASGGRSAGKIEQRAGRVMRPHEGKEWGTVHDFADRGAGLAHNQFKARRRTYKRLGYTIE